MVHPAPLIIMAPVPNKPSMYKSGRCPGLAAREILHVHGRYSNQVPVTIKDEAVAFPNFNFSKINFLASLQYSVATAICNDSLEVTNSGAVANRKLGLRLKVPRLLVQLPLQREEFCTFTLVGFGLLTFAFGRSETKTTAN